MPDVTARVVGNAVFLEHPGGCGDIAAWGTDSHERAAFQAKQVNDAMAAAACEAARVRAALEMLAQVRHVSGSAQGAFRTTLRIVDAVLAGADVRDIAAVEAIAAGTWRRADAETT